MCRLLSFILLIFCMAFVCSAFTCSSYPAQAVPDAPDVLQDAPPPVESAPESLLLTFAGDLMAHTVNFNMKDYAPIYADIEELLHADDLSFVNVETPVCDALPLSTYPRFNVHTPYLRAAADAGFDVFGFANNHTNDQNTAGIDGSLAAIRMLQKEREASETAAQPLFFSGLKDTAKEAIRVTRISHKGWNILFCAVTELLNSYDVSKNRLYYSTPTKEGRAALLSIIRDARTQYPCDLFVLAVHLNEPEYIRTVAQSKKEWFKQLGEAGADIIWAHHPHVMQMWETIDVERPTSLSPEENGTELHKVFCMSSMGNFISGQRWTVRYDDPSYYREYTGDAVLLQLAYTRSDSSHAADFTVLPVLITQYNEPYPVVKRFTQEWMDTLNEKEKNYFTSRFALMKAYLPF